jgi:hypothetical protein
VRDRLVEHGLCRMEVPRDPTADAWCYLLDTLKPDIALVQEVMLAPPSWVLDRGRVLLRAAYGRLDWGSGIFLQGDAVPEDRCSPWFAHIGGGSDHSRRRSALSRKRARKHPK